MSCSTSCNPDFSDLHVTCTTDVLYKYLASIKPNNKIVSLTLLPGKSMAITELILKLHALESLDLLAFPEECDGLKKYIMCGDAFKIKTLSVSMLEPSTWQNLASSGIEHLHVKSYNPPVPYQLAFALKLRTLVCDVISPEFLAAILTTPGNTMTSLDLLSIDSSKKQMVIDAVRGPNCNLREVHCRGQQYSWLCEAVAKKNKLI